MCKYFKIIFAVATLLGMGAAVQAQQKYSDQVILLENVPSEVHDELRENKVTTMLTCGL